MNTHLFQRRHINDSSNFDDRRRLLVRPKKIPEGKLMEITFQKSGFNNLLKQDKETKSTDDVAEKQNQNYLRRPFTEGSDYREKKDPLEGAKKTAMGFTINTKLPHGLQRSLHLASERFQRLEKNEGRPSVLQGRMPASQEGRGKAVKSMMISPFRYSSQTRDEFQDLKSFSYSLNESNEGKTIASSATRKRQLSSGPNVGSEALFLIRRDKHLLMKRLTSKKSFPN